MNREGCVWRRHVCCQDNDHIWVRNICKTTEDDVFMLKDWMKIGDESKCVLIQEEIYVRREGK